MRKSTSLTKWFTAGSSQIPYFCRTCMYMYWQGAVNKGWGRVIFPGYYECDLWLLSLKKTMEIIPVDQN